MPHIWNLIYFLLLILSDLLTPESTRSRLKLHNQDMIAASNMLYRSSLCNAGLKNHNGMRDHLRKHISGFKKACDVCYKRFDTLSEVKKHRDVAHERSFSCDKCDAAFFTARHLDLHQAVHLTEKRFECPECKKLFKTQKLLRSHSFSHTELNLYKCEYCSSSLKTKAGLKSHREKHFIDHEYTCVQCNRKLMTRSNLGKHRWAGRKDAMCATRDLITFWFEGAQTNSMQWEVI